MNTRQRIRPLMSLMELFTIPRVLLLLALLLSCSPIVLGVLTETVPMNLIYGGACVAVLLGGFVSYLISFPLMYMFVLQASGAEGTATILKNEQLSESSSASVQEIGKTASLVTFQFTPVGATTPVQLTAKVKDIGSNLYVGKTAQIRYAQRNHRLVKFIGE